MTRDKMTSAEYLAALEDASRDDAGLNDGDPVTSEAERMAAAAQGPKIRKDGTLVSMQRPRPLTDAQAAFARGLIEGKTAKQAYRDAYPNALGEASVSTAAYKLNRDPRIQKLVQDAWDETQDALADDMAATKRYVMRQLVGWSKTAEAETTRVKAIELLGKAAGLFSGVHVSERKPLTAEQLKRELSGHLKLVNSSKGE